MSKDKELASFSFDKLRRIDVIDMHEGNCCWRKGSVSPRSSLQTALAFVSVPITKMLQLACRKVPWSLSDRSDYYDVVVTDYLGSNLEASGSFLLNGGRIRICCAIRHTARLPQGSKRQRWVLLMLKTTNNNRVFTADSLMANVESRLSTYERTREILQVS